jgi:RecB family exonuclease
MPAKPWVTEEDIYFDVGVGLPQARITMDRLDLVDGMIDIIDYKTGNVLVGKKISSELQPPMYIRAVQQKYKYPVRKFHLHYLAEGKERVYHRIDDDNYVCTVRKREYHVNITEKMKEVQQIFSKIVGGKFNIPQDTKSMFFACKMCHHKTEGRCRGADEESWYQKGW